MSERLQRYLATLAEPRPLVVVDAGCVCGDWRCSVLVVGLRLPHNLTNATLVYTIFSNN